MLGKKEEDNFLKRFKKKLVFYFCLLKEIKKPTHIRESDLLIFFGLIITLRNINLK